MLKKVLLAVLAFSVLFSIVSFTWFGSTDRRVQFSTIDQAIDSVNINAQLFRNDFELIGAGIETLDFIFDDTLSLYRIEVPRMQELLDEGSEFCYIVLVRYDVIGNETQVLSSQKITTSYSVEDFTDFVGFIAKYSSLITPLIARLGSFNSLFNLGIALPNQILTFFMPLLEVVSTVFVGLNVIIQALPLVFLLLLDSFALIKDIVLIPFRLLF